MGKWGEREGGRGKRRSSLSGQILESAPGDYY